MAYLAAIRAAASGLAAARSRNDSLQLYLPTALAYSKTGANIDINASLAFS